MPPLLSVIIPTHSRAALLRRAIDSALRSSHADVEVIVVPNGPDSSWRAIQAKYSSDPRVCWHPIDKANANAARNAGLSQARGSFVRFLDDDDYLYPDACQRQLSESATNRIDVCSADIDVVLANGKKIRTMKQPDTDDFASSTLMPRRMTATHAHLYRREALHGVAWNEKQTVRQDTAWLIELACSSELSWRRHPEAVGAWVQHGGTRISRGRDPGPEVLKSTAELILRAHESLSARGLLTSERSQAAADGLWASLQKGLQYDYSYWREIAKFADRVVPGRRPPSAIHRLPVFRQLPPLVVETVLVPLRVAYRPLRRALEKHGVGRV